MVVRVAYEVEYLEQLNQSLIDEQKMLTLEINALASVKRVQEKLKEFNLPLLPSSVRGQSEKL